VDGLATKQTRVSTGDLVASGAAARRHDPTDDAQWAVPAPGCRPRRCRVVPQVDEAADHRWDPRVGKVVAVVVTGGQLRPDRLPPAPRRRVASTNSTSTAPWPRPLIIAAINNGSEHHQPRPRCSVPVRLGSSGLLSPQLTACFTSAAILASSAAVNSVSAKATGHMAPSSRFATSLKPNVAYRDLNFCALWKKQTTLPSLA
jgi:hypothetical protein